MEGQESSQKCGKMQVVLGAAIFCPLYNVTAEGKDTGFSWLMT